MWELPQPSPSGNSEFKNSHYPPLFQNIIIQTNSLLNMKPIIQLSQNKEYKSWVKELKKRYLTARLKASVEANRTLLEYYWSLGRDISDRQYANTYGSAFYATLSHDLKTEMPGEQGFSESNIRYMYRFY